ncbi:hypothetical protein [Micromonospora sp. DH14]|uniref:hypothetical protein n=1 Tax=Micromonospora sp. DH14 TaxID=3040120 RepID=UPI002443365A|nr:hypothetical protein [Micromonospora sp. DH14]MDG9678682.1 hypothetical protein [Micromonospora sp. DH14]
MPDPQPGARPADGSTPGTEPERDPAVADEPTSPPVPPTQPEPPTRPEPSDQPETPDQPEPSDRSDQPKPPGEPEPAATAEVPAPRWSGSAPVPPPLPRRAAWGESAEPTPVPPVPVGPPEDQTPVDPWAGVDTGGWDLPSAELPPLPPTMTPPPPLPPPTMPFPRPSDTRQWSGPPAPPAGSHPVSPPAAPGPPRAVGPTVPARPMSPPAPPKVPKQRRGRRQTAPPPAPPGWQAPKGYVPVRRRRRWPWLLLLTLACCCGCPAYYGFPISAQYPARAALPVQVDDLSLRQDGRSTEAAKKLENEVRKEHWLAEDTFAGVYATTSGKRVTVFGGTGFRLSPESDAEAEISRLTDRYALSAPESVDTGVRGRHERCAVGSADGSDVVVCTSVDHGSIATGVFTRLSVADSADLLASLRAQIVQPERG